MNAERLKALVEDLLEDERTFKLQHHLNTLNKALANYVGQPQNAELQVQVAKALDAFATQVDHLIGQYEPAQLRRMEAIGALEFFGAHIVEGIQRVIAENSMTPAVVQRYVTELIKQRQAYLENLQATSHSLEALGFEADYVDAGTAEIGFQIPRELFQNELDGLIRELASIKRIIRAFSELATGSVEPIEIRQISTSDPLFFFGLGVATIAQLGCVVSWALHTWKQVEEIRKLRSDANKNKHFTKEEIEEFFGHKIRDMIEAAINEKTKELIKQARSSTERKEEQRNHIAWALKAILSRIERGMTVEIRFLPPPTPEATTEGEGPLEEPPEFKTLREITPQLVFPEPDPSPVVELPPAEPEKGTGTKRKSTGSS